MHAIQGQNDSRQERAHTNIFLPQNASCYDSDSVMNGIFLGGVPVVLALNFCGFLMLLLVFSIIRMKFSGYGRRARVADDKLVMEEGQANGNMPNEPPEAEEGLFSWIPFTINLSDEQIKAKSGQDAVHYLSLQRHLIFLLSIKTVISLSVIMPINWSGSLLSDVAVHFGRITIGNLPIGELLLWVHPVFAVVDLILTVFVLINHNRQVKNRKKETTRNTLMYCSVPKTATVEEIKAHFTEAYPTCEVTAVTLGYDVTDFSNLDQARIESGENLRYYEHVREKTGISKTINPRVCGHLCCCCKFEEVDAIEFYGSKEQDLLQKMRDQLEKQQPRPLGMAFVTFKTNAMAKLVLKDFNAIKCHKFCCGRKPKSSSKSDGLKVRNWSAGFASFARSIKWKNLAVKGFKWTGQYLVVNLALLVLVTFLTTPAMMVNTLDRFNVTASITDIMIPVVSQFLPTLLLLVCSSLLPAIVHHSTDLESRWSSSSEQLSTMRKLYFFLVFMVLILPSLGLTSLAGLFQWLFQRLIYGVGTMRFACVFLPDHGVFVVNYVITAGFMGSAMLLLRLPELLLYAINLVFARSAAERKYITQNQAYESAYGAMYGWTLCVFTICVAYSIICPIITPCGLLFVMVRHFVDKHNLYFAYLPNPLDSHVHMAAIDMVMVAPILCLLWLYFYFFDTAGFLSPIAMFTMVFLLIVVVLCITHKFFGYFKNLSPQNYKVKEEDKEEVAEEEQEVFLPRALYPEAPVCAMMQETNEAADDTMAFRSSQVVENMSFSAIMIHDLFEGTNNSLTITTSPCVEVRLTDSVHSTDTDKLISEK